MKWWTKHDRVDTGLLPMFLSAADPRGAVAQLNDAYAHGGGWRPFKGFKLVGRSTSDFVLQYPDDPPLPLLAWTMLRGELVGLFLGSWVVVVQPDGRFEVCRMD